MVRTLYWFNLLINCMMYVSAAMIAGGGLSYLIDIFRDGVSAFLVIMVVFCACTSVAVLWQARRMSAERKFLLAHVRQNRRRYLNALTRFRKILVGLEMKPFENGEDYIAYVSRIDGNPEYRNVVVVSNHRRRLYLSWLVHEEFESAYNPDTMHDDHSALAQMYEYTKGTILVPKAMTASPVEDGNVTLRTPGLSSKGTFVAGIGRVRDRTTAPVIGVEYAACDELEQLADILEQTTNAKKSE